MNDMTEIIFIRLNINRMSGQMEIARQFLDFKPESKINLNPFSSFTWLQRDTPPGSFQWVFSQCFPPFPPHVALGHPIVKGKMCNLMDGCVAF